MKAEWLLQTMNNITKNLSILEYLASKPKQGINDISSKYINKSSLNKKDFPKYFFDY